MAEFSKNDRAESVVGRRLTPALEKTGVVPFDFPCEQGYWCPVCRIDPSALDTSLHWSEYASFLWCATCDFDWPSALCVPLEKKPDPDRPYVKAGREAAVRVFLDTVANAIDRTKRPVAEEGGERG